MTLNAAIEIPLANGLKLRFVPFTPPQSLATQHPGAVSIKMELWVEGGTDFVLERVFHGCYIRGDDVCFYKPSDRKTGDLWRNHYRDPKTGKTVFYKLYGGKITGILVQSMCRELFFDAMRNLFQELEGITNARPIGQFHDELVVSWTPRKKPSTEVSLEFAKELMVRAMSTVRLSFAGFPLFADIKDDYRYTK